MGSSVSRGSSPRDMISAGLARPSKFEGSRTWVRVFFM